MALFSRPKAFTAGLLVLLALIATLALRVWTASVDRHLEANWRHALGGASFLERYPATEDNATVRDLERIGAAIGIEMAPADTPGRVHAAPEAVKRFEAIQAPMKAFLRGNRDSAGDPLAPMPAQVGAYLDSVRPALDAIRARLAQGPPPVWKRDLGAGLAARIPNYLGVLTLQNFLLLDASAQLQARREMQAAEILEASWRLNQAMAENTPVLIAQLIAQAVIRLQQPVLRGFSRPPAGWSERLHHLDLQSHILLALQCEAFGAYRSATLEGPVPGVEVGPHSQPFAHWIVWDYARRLEAMLEDLSRRDVRTFDPEAFNREKLASIPRWQVPARLLLANFWDTWPRSAHADLEVELTALTLEERERLAAGGPSRPSDLRPSRVKGLSWMYQNVPGGTLLHLDGDLLYKEAKAAPLRYKVRKIAR